MLRLAVLTAALAAVLGSTPDLPQSYIFTGPGKFSHLRAHTTYRASQFPFELRVTPPDGTWWSAQWKSGRDYFRGGAPPNFGWVHLTRNAPRANAPPNGMISIMAAYGRTPSVAATVHVLRTRGRGATYGAVTPVTLAGASGQEFDGQITGAKNFDHVGHFFVPFSPRSHAARYYADEYGVYGDAFRVIVLGVRGHTVVIYVENVALPAEKFPAFLDQAAHILASLRFPAHA